jgi:hypothetical protein
MNPGRIEQLALQLLMQQANDPAKDPRYAGQSFAPDTPLGFASDIPSILQTGDLAYPRSAPDARFRFQ